MGIIRKTKSLELLLKEFQNEKNAISVIDLIERLNSKLNKTTIYRVLEKLEEDGVLHSILSNRGTKWYARCNGCSESNHNDLHPHFECSNCGKIDCLNIEFQIPIIPNRNVRSSQILFQGKCEACF
ncbi:MAG: transcriptional regulator [Flavobacteriaceae bacterium]|nr:transcriptional regulator [Flavobacteriaceae bacterium]|tara:strand:+ start:139 stop:516 length:378 start_codon:yes stop_codon:yes gene_type:complete